MLELIDFYADWCGPCQVMHPILETLEKEYKDKVQFKKINVEVNNAEAAKFQVMSIPTFIVLKDQKEIARKMGAMPKEVLKAWLDEVIKSQNA